jgi:hypothetical protein
MHAQVGETGIIRADQNGVTVYVQANAGEASYEYEFDRSMRITKVRTTSQTIMEHLRLKKEGNLCSVAGDQYLDAMGEAARYWDGRSWVPYQEFVQSHNFSLR